MLNVLLDGALAAVATPLARYLADPTGGLLHPLWFIGGGAVTLLGAGLPFRMPQQYWRFSGIEDLIGVVGSSTISAALFAALLLVSGFPLPTDTFPVVHALTLVVALGAPRVVYRLRRGRPKAGEGGAQTVLLAGAGENADVFLRALDTREGRAAFRVVGLLSSGAGNVGRRMHGRPILGVLNDAGPVLAKLRQEGRPVSTVVVTEPELDGARLAALVAEAEAAGGTVRRMPPPTRLVGSVDPPAALAPIAIEDLLNRPQVPLDREGMARLVGGRRVLVTGAGGTIGSELARQIASLAPGLLVLLDNGEYALWQIDTELAETHPELARQICLADIRDETRIRAVCDAVRPELVFHAAALKHVPMVEANPLEGLMTNAVGTRIVADAARAAGAAEMVFISTDKAVNPSSVMGASKRLAEMYVQALARTSRPGGMHYVTVRFGNVLGSTGSVVPLFRRQLERGGPLTVTHPDMQRYFMTVREAVGLVLQASVVGGQTALAAVQRERGGIFVLDMGPPVRIVDLARQMIRLAGLKVAPGEGPRPPDSVAIQFTGLRPGEKLFEELFHGKEPPQPTDFPGLLTATPRTADPAIVARCLDEIAAACRADQPATALSLLGRMVPEYERDMQAAAPTGAVQ
ncbi:MAG: nucleoside-diphosphate sugar epimerase/dehydratase [Acetobacteraceae bacterium]|nr:nucleoside-diphosphate sugar epimerase/dehydratase [Acetobacteraceae bacterium]